MKRGTVKSWRNAWGFVTGDDGHDVFVHFSAIQVEGYKSLAVGDRVEYEAEVSDRGLRATAVFRITDEDEGAA